MLESNGTLQAAAAIWLEQELGTKINTLDTCIKTVVVVLNLSQCFSLEIGAGLNSLTIIDNVVSDLDSTRRNFRGFFTDPDTNRLSVIKGGQNVNGVDTTSTNCQIEEFDTFNDTWRATQNGQNLVDLYDPDETKREVLWHSKVIVLEKPTSMAFVKVLCNTYKHGGVKINVFGIEASNLENNGHYISTGFQLLSATIVESGGQLQVSGTSSVGNTNNPQVLLLQSLQNLFYDYLEGYAKNTV